MFSKMLGIVTAVLVVTVIAVAVQMYSLSKNASRLKERVETLEVQNVQLSLQMSRISEKRGTQHSDNRSARRDDSRTAETTVDSTSSTLEIKSIDAVDSQGKALSAVLRQEVAELVEKEQSAVMDKRRAEQEERMLSAMSQSVKEFAEDQGIDVEIADQLERLMEDTMTKRRALRDELEAENISFYEFRQEQRKQRDETDDKLSKMLSDKQMEAFEDAFPFGRRGPR